MAAEQPTKTARRMPSVFLSYASEDRQYVQAIREALPGLGLDVWYDESALGGGEAWDQKIRRQIRECDYFMPIVSARTEARSEGYFRREWRFAVERTLDMADDHVFLVPVVIDDTVGETARVPEKFLTVQWSRLPGGQPNAAFESMCRRLASGQTIEPPPAKKEPAARASKATSKPAPSPRYPDFPHQEPGQSARFYGQAAAWTLHSAWISFNRLPKWVRILAYVWMFILFIQRCESSSSDEKTTRASKADAQKFKEISDKYVSKYVDASDKADVAALAAQIASQFPDEAAASDQGKKTRLLAIPFRAPADDQHAKAIAGAVFSQMYGQVAIAQHGHVGIAPDAPPPADPDAAAQLGRAKHATYVVYGVVDKEPSPPSLTIKLIESEDGSVVWSKSYPVAGADPAKIAAEVESKVPTPDSE